MSESMPSKPIHFFDVPEVKNISAEFKYNFFVSDETIDESGNESVNGNLSTRFLRKGTADMTNLNSRIPRYVELSFSLSDTKKPMLGSRKLRRGGFMMTSAEILQALNDQKIVTEDAASENRYTSLCISNKSYDLSLENFMRTTLNRYVSEESSVQDAVVELSQTTNVNSNMISKRMVPPSLNEKPVSPKSKRFNNRIRKVKNLVQLNSAYAPMMLRKSAERGTSLRDQSLLSDYLISVNEKALRTDFDVTQEENIFDIPVVDQERAPSARFTSEAAIIGLIVEKFRVYKGKKYRMPPVIIAGPRPEKGYDSQVAYGQTYEYSVRTLAKFRVPATMQDGRTYIQTFLVASKPSQTIQVTLQEDREPTIPQDVNYHYDFSSDSLYITWSPPVNPQRDVKYYQVFRRKSLEEPFQLLAQLDFDDSVIRTQPQESVDSETIISYSSMPTYYIDSDFDKSSSYIYALVSVDARQLSSKYSTQTMISFDKTKNKIRKEFVCYSGAPKQYPNWTLKENFFVDTMKDSSHSSVNIYFNPEAYKLIRSNGEVIPAFYSKSEDPLAKYVFQFINTDRLLEQKFEATIDDSNFNADRGSEQELEEDDDE